MKRITPLLLTLVCLVVAGCNRSAVEEAARLRNENEILRKEGVEARITIERQKSEMGAAHQRVADFEKQLTQYRGEVETLRKECAEIRADLAGSRARAEQATLEKSALEKQIAAAEADRARNAKGTLVGAVSYFFNDNYGDKPDTGSKIFIIPAGNAPDFGSKCRKYIELKYAAIRGDEAKSKEWKDAGTKLTEYLIPFLYDPKTTKLLADGSGAFSMKLPPGKYSILVKSAHRTALTVAEVDGSIQYFDAEIKPDEQANIAARFFLQ